MPQMGADMTEGTVVRWLKKEGETVTRGEIIAEIETDKANVEIEAFEGGVFRKALAAEGDVVQVGEVIAVIAGAGDDISKYSEPLDAKGAPKAAIAPAASAVKTAGAVVAARSSDPESRSRPAAPAPASAQQVPRAPATNGRLRVSPVARRIAQERGIDLAAVQGSGPDGRIVRHDVESFAGAPPRPTTDVAPAPASATAAPAVISKMRQAIARRMAQSKREAPHYYLLVDVDMTDAMAFRQQANEDLGEESRISINDLIVKACAIALQRHPAFNATIAADAVARQERQNICIGIALDDGLIAPAILDAGSKPLARIAAESKDLVTRSKGGSLRADELTAGTFTISNLGAYGIETLVAIIQPPQTAILGVGSVTEAAGVRDGTVVVRQVMKLALSADHRVTDGSEGARFLSEIKHLLEKPLLLVL